MLCRARRVESLCLFDLDPKRAVLMRVCFTMRPFFLRCVIFLLVGRGSLQASKNMPKSRSTPVGLNDAINGGGKPSSSKRRGNLGWLALTPRS